MKITFKKAAFFFSPRGKRIAKIEGTLAIIILAIIPSLMMFVLGKAVFFPKELILFAVSLTFILSCVFLWYFVFGILSSNGISFFISRFFEATPEELRQFIEMKIKKVEDAINDTDNRRVKLEFEKEELEREINKLSDEALELISEREELLKNKI
ncbi:hypothetical protein A3A09_03480 [Candidatus Nomurabacteria bacterium RIFCSPLOWO2_01_FULL_42_20]|uniref:Uncharacterized protein n=1 Tax=Candidatus Nomurabacteria bacterium RIFCSPHIGHO2_01_FULL_42_16 TaxID=1801743 RepID=A0A1F6VJY2_9BACT|nr:MAG: hypothetical protein A2824_01500 [Candidatus Nomurabacteria bacterium RIFCSPHIGHO2_01_FULL_42_16]OGI91445.1 MAG: hypothetical protein A3A09_03480 [Candidatus Nomurabacteria bacterium RIFCSPLOWO2_01_FULL_42_20]